MIRGYTNRVSGTCGLCVLWGFKEPEGYSAPSLNGGTGFCVAGFVDHFNCVRTYKEIARKYPIVYQSPVRRNKNSGNDFFFIIFDTRKTS
jgi:hypothetical protein